MKKLSGGKDSKKLLGYLAAAAGALAISTPAEAVIHYSGVRNLVVDNNTDYVGVDLNGDGIDDFGFSYFSSPALLVLYPLFNSTFEDTNSFIYYFYYYSVANLKHGFIIKNDLPYSYYWTNTSSGYLASHYGGYNFANATGYIGVRFHSAECNGTDWHYGWIQFEGAADASWGKIIDWAYEDECNKPIIAGDRGERASVPVLDPVGAAGLAVLLGGAGALGLKRRKKEDEDKE